MDEFNDQQNLNIVETSHFQNQNLVHGVIKFLENAIGTDSSEEIFDRPPTERLQNTLGTIDEDEDEQYYIEYVYTKTSVEPSNSKSISKSEFDHIEKQIFDVEIEEH